MLHSLGANQSFEMTMQSVLAPHFVVITQCSPYQEVTAKSYHLKQHFLPPATAWRFTKWNKVVLKNTLVVLPSDPIKEMNE